MSVHRLRMAAGATAVLATAALAAGPAAATSGTATSSGSGAGRSAHVLLLSGDGMHSSDLFWYVGRHPR